MARQPPRDDPQRLRVYNMEASIGYSDVNAYSIAAARSWVRWACTKYGVKPPKVSKAPKGATMSYCKAKGDKVWIALIPAHQNTLSALHESAHAICERLYGAAYWDNLQSHGPEWLGIYFWLVKRAGLLPMEALVAMAKKHKLQYKNLPPSRFRKRS